MRRVKDCTTGVCVCEHCQTKPSHQTSRLGEHIGDKKNERTLTAWCGIGTYSFCQEDCPSPYISRKLCQTSSCLMLSSGKKKVSSCVDLDFACTFFLVRRACSLEKFDLTGASSPCGSCSYFFRFFLRK